VTATAAFSNDHFRILAVCTGNICRSPLVEHLLREGLKDLPAVEVASAGVGALVGEPMTPETIAIAHEHGAYAPEDHRARQLVTDDLRGADLVVALTRAHRSELVAMLPRGSRHTFTLRELARLFDAMEPSDLAAIAALPLDDTAGRLIQLVNSAASLRGHVTPPEHEVDDDVIDPYRRDDEVYRQATGQLVPAVDSILKRFGLAATLATAGLDE
jgi:protein-tyrosine phosphatase